MRRSALFSSTLLAGLVLSTAAFAQATQPGQTSATPDQTTAQQAETTAATAATDRDTVVVTGSRIRRNEFTSSAPIQVITAEESTLEGLTDTTQILQHASTANNATQINNFFTGFNVNGGAGVNTLNLRGLGAARTLVILNGRRLGPAGVGGTVGQVDLNTIPGSIIDHVEILKDGASSVYGSDAVAGVVNIITKKNLNGGDIHINVNPSWKRGGDTWEADASYGKRFDRGYFSLSGSVYRQDALHTGQRSYTRCTTDLVTDPSTGQRVDIIDPGTGQPKCQNSAFLGQIVDVSFTGYTYALDPTARETAVTFGRRGAGGRPSPGDFLFGGPGANDLNGLRSVGNVYHTNGQIDSPLVGPLTGCTESFNPATNTCPPVDISASRASLAQFGTDDPRLGRTTAISPVRRYSIMASGGYDLNSHNSLYAEVLLNRRESNQLALGQLFPSVDPGNRFNPFVGTFLDGATAFPVSLRYFTDDQHVDYGRAVVGMRGDLPTNPWLKGWTYDIFGQYSRSKAVYGQTFTYQDRVNATAGSSNAAGCDPNATVDGSPTLAQIEGAGAQCLAVNYFTPLALAGQFTPQEHAYLFGYEVGHTSYDFAYVEGSATGDLFRLPAGTASAAVGFHARYERLNDEPGQNAQLGNYWGATTGGATKGSANVKEVFGEVNVPLLANFPLVQKLTLDLSGRYSDYNLFGSASTYKVGLDWTVVNWLRFRATRGTSFRAPTLYEHFLSPTTGFGSQINVDPCINTAGSAQPQVVKTNCQAASGPGGGVPTTYLGGGVGVTISTGGGAKLQPETSTADTIGFVFTPRWFGLDLSLAVDYFTYDVQDQIQQFGAGNIVSQCYRSQNFPNDPFCALFTRDPTTHNITTVRNDYVNVAEQIERGIDATIRFTHRLPYGVAFRFNSDLNWTVGGRTKLVNGKNDSNNSLGAVGQPTFVGNMTFRFDKGPWTVNWFTDMVGHSSDLQFLGGNTFNNYQGMGIQARGNYVVPFYATHTLSLRRQFTGFTVEAGVKNLFDKKPPLYSTSGFQSLIGQAPLTSQYDLVGRSIFLDFDKRF